MEDGLLSLKWNNHKNTFFDILKGLRDKANYTDATLAVEGKFYPVHKLVLSTCSEYFSEIFDRTPCKSPVIVLKDVRYQDLESLLDYMYLGEVSVNQNDLAVLLKTAECLRVKGLAIPDEDTSHLSPVDYDNQSTKDNHPDSPPPKRRKENENSSNSPHRVSKCSSTPKNVSQSLENSKHSQILLDTAVKIELDDEDEENSETDITPHEDNVHTREISVEREDQNSNSCYVGSNLLSSQTCETQWEDAESSFPQDSFSDASTNQQTGGDDEEDVDVTSVGNQNVYHNMSLTQSKEARRCQLCQVTLANANLLRRHVEDHHFHIRKYDCIHCGKKFKRKEHRERHERIHTGEKPFACHICTNRFTQKEHLKGHIENVHYKHSRDKDRDTNLKIDIRDDDGERSESSPPSLASPTSISTLVTSPLSSVFPNTFSLTRTDGGSMWEPSTSSSQPISTVMSSLTSVLPNTFSLTPQLIPPSSAASPPLPSSTILPATSTSSEGNSVVALYAPHTRKSAASPNKHVQTITINFN